MMSFIHCSRMDFAFSTFWLTLFYMMLAQCIKGGTVVEGDTNATPPGSSALYPNVPNNASTVVESTEATYDTPPGSSAVYPNVPNNASTVVESTDATNITANETLAMHPTSPTMVKSKDGTTITLPESTLVKPNPPTMVESTDGTNTTAYTSSAVYPTAPTMLESTDVSNTTQPGSPAVYPTMVDSTLGTSTTPPESTLVKPNAVSMGESNLAAHTTPPWTSTVAPIVESTLSTYGFPTVSSLVTPIAATTSDSTQNAAFPPRSFTFVNNRPGSTLKNTSSDTNALRKQIDFINSPRNQPSLKKENKKYHAEDDDTTHVFKYEAKNNTYHDSMSVKKNDTYSYDFGNNSTTERSNKSTITPIYVVTKPDGTIANSPLNGATNSNWISELFIAQTVISFVVYVILMVLLAILVGRRRKARVNRRNLGLELDNVA